MSCDVGHRAAQIWHCCCCVWQAAVALIQPLAQELPNAASVALKSKKQKKKKRKKENLGFRNPDWIKD